MRENVVSTVLTPIVLLILSFDTEANPLRGLSHCLNTEDCIGANRRCHRNKTMTEGRCICKDGFSEVANSAIKCTKVEYKECINDNDCDDDFTCQSVRLVLNAGQHLQFPWPLDVSASDIEKSVDASANKDMEINSARQKMIAVHDWLRNIITISRQNSAPDISACQPSGLLLLESSDEVVGSQSQSDDGKHTGRGGLVESSAPREGGFPFGLGNGGLHDPAIRLRDKRSFSRRFFEDGMLIVFCGSILGSLLFIHRMSCSETDESASSSTNDDSAAITQNRSDLQGDTSTGRRRGSSALSSNIRLSSVGRSRQFVSSLVDPPPPYPSTGSANSSRPGFIRNGSSETGSHDSRGSHVRPVRAEDNVYEIDVRFSASCSLPMDPLNVAADLRHCSETGQGRTSSPPPSYTTAIQVLNSTPESTAIDQSESTQ